MTDKYIEELLEKYDYLKKIRQDKRAMDVLNLIAVYLFKNNK